MTVGASGTTAGALVGGKYRIVRLLAQGGMGVIYEAHHAVVRRRFAIKFLRRDLALRREILTRFQREAEAAGALENENVAAAVDFGISDDGTPYIVMEYLVGESVGALLEREGRLPARRACDLVAQACRGVEAAHAAGIVHRDLKPHNLFVCRREDGTDLVKVLDFGVAKLQAIEASNAATDTGTLLGTAAYMSPEQARGEKMVDQRADVYALGAIAYELLSQQKPHPGDSQNAILHHIATQPAAPLDGVAPELAEVIARTLASDPGARPQTAAALATALAPFAGREVWPAAPLPVAPGPEAPLPAPARTRIRRALIAALALVPIAVAGGVLWGKGRTPRTASARGDSSTVPAVSPPPAPARIEAERTSTAGASEGPHVRTEPVGRLTGRASPAGARRPAAVRPAAQAPDRAAGVLPRSPEPAAVVPAFDAENPYK
jgi:eukaryotic-like serine/threonine-protein kinase